MAEINEKDSITVIIETNLKNTFKAQCAQKGIAMTDVILSAINNFVNSNQARARRRA